MREILPVVFRRVLETFHNRVDQGKNRALAANSMNPKLRPVSISGMFSSDQLEVLSSTTDALHFLRNPYFLLATIIPQDHNCYTSMMKVCN
jgi:hypothetical protein